MDFLKFFAHEIQIALIASIAAAPGKLAPVGVLPRAQERPDDQPHCTEHRIEFAFGARRPEKTEEERDGGPEQQVGREKAASRQRARHLAGLERVPAIRTGLVIQRSHAASSCVNSGEGAQHHVAAQDNQRHAEPPVEDQRL